MNNKGAKNKTQKSHLVIIHIETNNSHNCVVFFFNSRINASHLCYGRDTQTMTIRQCERKRERDRTNGKRITTIAFKISWFVWIYN